MTRRVESRVKLQILQRKVLAGQHQGSFPVLVGPGRTLVPEAAVGLELLVPDLLQWHESCVDRNM